MPKPLAEEKKATSKWLAVKGKPAATKGKQTTGLVVPAKKKWGLFT